MPLHSPSRLRRGSLAGLALVCLGCAAPLRADVPTGARNSQDVRAVVERVLSAPEYNRGEANTEGWWSWLWKKITDAVRGLRDWLHNLPGWLFYFIVAWLVLALLAILGHLLYVVVTQFGRGGGARRERQSAASPAVYGTADLDFASAHGRAESARWAGDWAAAIRWYYLAALLWLDRENLVRFVQSKTNHDYARELAGRGEVGLQFEQMTAAFENVVYGGRPANATVCGSVAATLETLRREVDARKPA